MRHAFNDMPFIRLASAGGPGIACGIGGVTLGAARLVIAERIDGKSPYRLASAEEVAEAFILAYGIESPLELARRFLSLERITDCLNRRDLTRAMTLALLMRLSAVSDAGMAKLHVAEARLKYSPDQPRVPAGNPDGGQWTSGEGTNEAGPSGSGSTAQAIPLPLEVPIPLTPELMPIPQEIAPPPFYPITPYNPRPYDPECVEEWDAAYRYCDEQERLGNFRPGYSGPGADFDKCLAGYVSERCGGNPSA